MATIKLNRLSGGFKMIPEGWHTFRIDSVNYDQTFGKVEIEMVTEDGHKHIERFYLVTKSGQPSEGAQNAFSYFVATAMDDWDMDEVDPQEMVGRFIEADVIHRASDRINENTGKPYVHANLGDKKPSDGWAGAEEEVEEDEGGLDDLLGLLD